MQVSIIKLIVLLISNFRRVLNIVCILLGISPASDYGLPTFRNTLSIPSSKAGFEVWLVRGVRGIYSGAEVYSSWWDR